MTNQEIDRIECAIRHIQTSIDIDPWAVEIAVEAMEKEISALQAQDSPKPTAESVQNVQNEDLILRNAAIEALGKRPMVWTDDDQYALGERNQYDINRLAIETLPSAQPERETAKFIRWVECKRTADYISYTPRCKCSKCGTEFLIETIKYCYICGARMER